MFIPLRTFNLQYSEKPKLISFHCLSVEYYEKQKQK